jgi:cardiolipin synthase
LGALFRLALGAAILALSACANQLPLVPAPGATHELTPVRTTRLEGSNGALSQRKSTALVGRTRSEGRPHAFDNQLAILEHAGETLSAGNGVELLVDGPATFAAMFADLETASKQILLESYIFEGKELGRRLADTLLRKRADGLDVRVIFDSVGSLLTPGAFFDELREGGVAVCEFNPVSPFRRATGLLNLNLRDHRKLLVVDQQVAFIGGINVSGVYSSGSVVSRRKAASDAQTGWRDTDVRIKGPAVREFTSLFQDTWQRQGCAADLPPLAATAAPRSGNKLVAVIGSVADEDSSRLYRALLGAINGAIDSIHITMGYFVPDPQSLEALAAAAARGAKVVLVLPGFSDSKIVLRAGQAHYASLLAAGVRIFELHDALLHAKTVVIDGVWTTVGSANFDWRSFLHNDELNAIILGEEFGSRMERLFADDQARAQEVTIEEWNKRGPGRRFMETLGSVLEYWL